MVRRELGGKVLMGDLVQDATSGGSAIGNAHLAINRFEMIIHSVGANEQFLPDLVVLEPLREEEHYIKFTTA